LIFSDIFLKIMGVLFGMIISGEEFSVLGDFLFGYLNNLKNNGV